MATLGQELTRLRRLKGWTLREVEAKTKRKVSNSYLYQLERDIVREPSPNILHALAMVYGVSYAALLGLAGFVVPNVRGGTARNHSSVVFSSLELTHDEEERVLDFIEYLRSKKRTKR